MATTAIVVDPSLIRPETSVEISDVGHPRARRSTRGVAEEAPGAYKDVSAVVEATEHVGLSRAVARLEPVICVKG
jgi:RNA-splicing ligase RtcB